MGWKPAVRQREASDPWPVNGRTQPLDQGKLIHRFRLKPKLSSWTTGFARTTAPRSRVEGDILTTSALERALYGGNTHRFVVVPASVSIALSSANSAVPPAGNDASSTARGFACMASSNEPSFIQLGLVAAPT